MRLLVYVILGLLPFLTYFLWARRFARARPSVLRLVVAGLLGLLALALTEGALEALLAPWVPRNLVGSLPQLLLYSLRWFLLLLPAPFLLGFLTPSITGDGWGKVPFSLQVAVVFSWVVYINVIRLFMRLLFGL